MGRDVRFLILNRDEGCSKELQATLLKAPRAKVVAELDEPAMLEQAVRQFHVDGVLINLDPNPETMLPIIGQLVEQGIEASIFATSESTDGPLILKAIRMGVKEFLPKPIDSDTLIEAVDRLAQNRLDTGKQGDIITVMGTAGGVGATLLATNIAVELADMVDGTVVVMDLDYRFGQVATVLDIEPTFTLADLCESPEQLEPQVIERALVKHSSGVRVLSRPSSLAEADTMTAASCVGLLSALAQCSDYVVIDGPHRGDLRAKSVLDMADVNLLLVQSLVPCVRNATRILNGIREAGGALDRTNLIANRVGRGSTDLTNDDVATTLDLEMFASIPNDWATVSGAINLGEPLKTFSPKSKVRLAIQEIAERLHRTESETDETDAQKKGLIGRIFAAG